MMEVRNLTLAHGTRVLAREISFRADGGECLLLAGPNGCGKTTLLRELAHRYPGCVLIPTGIPKVKGFTLEQFVRTACYKESNWAGRLSGQTALRLEAALRLLNLEGLRTQDISTLSDGEFQKACIAVGLTKKADVLILDEPTAYLDVENRIMVLETLREVAQSGGMAVIFSSHDLHESLNVCRRVLAFTQGGAFLESRKENRLEVLQAAFPKFRY